MKPGISLYSSLFFFNLLDRDDKFLSVIPYQALMARRYAVPCTTKAGRDQGT